MSKCCRVDYIVMQLKSQRIARGIPRHVVAAALDVSSSTLWKLEALTMNHPPLDMLISYAEAVGMKIEIKVELVKAETR